MRAASLFDVDDTRRFVWCLDINDRFVKREQLCATSSQRRARSVLSGAMQRYGARAVVIGASIAGLCAARVLSDFYDEVTLYERDDLPDGPANRAAVPQGRHVHLL